MSTHNIRFRGEITKILVQYNTLQWPTLGWLKIGFCRELAVAESSNICKIAFWGKESGCYKAVAVVER